MDVSGWGEADSHHSGYVVLKELDSPIDLTGHILSPFYIRNLNYQDSRFHYITHLMCYRYAVAAGQMTDFPTPKFKTIAWEQQWRAVLMDVYSHLCLTDVSAKTVIQSGPRPFKLHCAKLWGYIPNDPDTGLRASIVSDILIDTCVLATSDKLTSCIWLSFSTRVEKCGAFIGPGTPGAYIKADARGGIGIHSHCMLIRLECSEYHWPLAAADSSLHYDC